MLGQLLGGLGGLAIGGIADLFDNSEEEAEQKRLQNQQMALQELKNARAYIPQANFAGFQQANDGARRAAQHAALAQIARRRPEDEERGY